MTITINIPDAVAARVLNGFASSQGYQATIDGQANPESKQQFLKRRVIEFIHNHVKFDESEAAARTAKTAASQNVDSEISLT